MLKRLLISTLIFFLLVIPVSALVVTLNLTWENIQDYHVQEGSIVQVIAYRSNQGSNPSGGANNNFDVVGDYLGESIYDAYTTPNNHNIVYQTTVNQLLFSYYVYESFLLLGDYNRIYVRIFNEINLEEDVVLSYWGITPRQNFNHFPVTIYYNNFNHITNENYFGTPYFEVIPEVPTWNLILLGAITFVIWSMCKRKNEH